MSSRAQSPQIRKIVKNYLDSNGENEELDQKSDFIDYFGFYHPEGLSARQKRQETVCRENDIHRFQKWSKMVGTDGKKKHEENWKRYYREGKSTEKLRRRVFKGIPNFSRTIVWPLLLRVSDIKMLKENRKAYDNLFHIALEKSEYLEQIDLDINRTYRNTSFFVSRFGARQKSLFKILAAYSVYNPDVGYCQGLSDIAGILLMYIHDDEDAFWAFCQLMNGPKHSMHGMFTPSFPTLNRLFVHHERVICRMLPRLFSHLNKECVLTTTYALKWFMQCFIGRMPISLTFRLWDIYLLEGEKLLIAQAYNILKMHKKSLLSMDACRIMTFLQDDLSKDFLFNDEDVIDSLKECLEILHKNRLDVLPPLTEEMLPKQPLGQILLEYNNTVWEKTNDQLHHTLTYSQTKNDHGDKPGDDSTLNKQQKYSKSAYNTIESDRRSNVNRKSDTRFVKEQKAANDVIYTQINNTNRVLDRQDVPERISVITKFDGNNPTTEYLDDKSPAAEQSPMNMEKVKSPMSVIISNGVTNPLFPGPVSPPLSDTASISVHGMTHEPSDVDLPSTMSANQERKLLNNTSGVPRQIADYSSNSLKRNSIHSSGSSYSQFIMTTPEKKYPSNSINSNASIRNLAAEHETRTFMVASALVDGVEKRVNQQFGDPIPNHELISSPNSTSPNNTSGVWIQREYDSSTPISPSDNIKILYPPQKQQEPAGHIPLVFDISQISRMNPSSTQSNYASAPRPTDKTFSNTEVKKNSPHRPVSRTNYTAPSQASLDRNFSPKAPLRDNQIRTLKSLQDYAVAQKYFEKKTFFIDADQIENLIEKASSPTSTIKNESNKIE